MAKVKKLKSANIRKITGGKDPSRLVEEFLTKRGVDPEECLQQRTSDIVTWSVPLSDDEELEITLEGLNCSPETTLYMGVNVFAVPIVNSHSVLAAALIVADTLIGGKLSLVNYDLVLSITVYTANMGIDDIDYYYNLIMRQRVGVQESIIEELGGGA